MSGRQFSMLPCCVEGVEAMAADSAHVFGRHTHEQFGVGVIARGAHRSASGRGIVEAGAGDIITVNPGEVHDGKPIGDGGRAWRMLYIDPAIVGSLAADIGAEEGSLARSEFEHPALRDRRWARLFDAAFRALTSTDAQVHRFESDEALLRLLAGLLQARPRQGGGVPQGVTLARAWIDDDPLAPLTLEALAAEAGLSQYQLLRGFARMTGMTPHAYLMQRRVHAVRRKIRDGHALADAATACGFCDQSHMTRLFVRSFGITPGRYARSLGRSS